MRVGILTYYSIFNFGANLQALSTYSYFKNNGFTPIFINWLPENLEKHYIIKTPKSQIDTHIDFVKKYLKETKTCRTDEDIYEVIKDNELKAIIIGSDAVLQHWPLLSRILLTKKGIKILKPMDDQIFPNPFWGTFLVNNHQDLPLVFLSASAQNTDFHFFGKGIKGQMMRVFERANYLSVRDIWTQALVKNISKNTIIPDITPDPVFGFNYNFDLNISKEEICRRFGLPEKYILLTLFERKNSPNKIWVKEFIRIAGEKGYTCVGLPLPSSKIEFEFPITISRPLSPIDWYYLLKNSSGYVGINMHPIIVCLHNSVPFFSFDNYGISYLKFFIRKKGSKIYHILDKADFLNNRFSIREFKVRIIKPNIVLDKIINFEIKKCQEFSRKQFIEYQNMMLNITRLISKE